MRKATKSRLLRRAMNVSQEEVSNVSEIPRWKLAWAETHRRELTNDEMQRVVDALLQVARQRVAALESEMLKSSL